MPEQRYNIVAIRDGRTVTTVVIVDGEDTYAIVKIPDLNISTRVEIKVGAPNAVVDGLDKVIDEDNFLSEEEFRVVDEGGSAELVLVVESSNAFITAESGKKIGFVLDISVFNTILDKDGNEIDSYNISRLQGLISVIIPLDEEFQGKNNYVIYRMHGDIMQILTTIPNIDGEYFQLTPDGKYIIVYTMNFSAYAIGFDVEDLVHNIPSFEKDDCIIHWLFLAFDLIYIAFFFVMFLVFKQKNNLAHYIALIIFAAVLAVLAVFSKWDVMCIVLFTLGAVITLTLAVCFVLQGMLYKRRKND